MTRTALRILPLSIARRFVRRDDGSVAVEFGLIVVPFLAIVFAILETALVFFAGQTLETAVGDAGRLISTGQVQSQSFDAAKFKQSVCARVFAIFDCANGIKIDVRSYSSFGAAAPPPMVDANGNFTNDLQYQPGGPGDIVVVRLAYAFPIYTSLLSLGGLSNMSNSQRLVVATAAFRNEPYQ